MLLIALKDAYSTFKYPFIKALTSTFVYSGIVYQFKVLFQTDDCPSVFIWVFTLVPAWAHSKGICLL